MKKFSKAQYYSPDGFGEFLADILKSDREAVVVVDGFKGEGKSALMDKSAKATSRYTKIPYSIKTNLTWIRNELKEWIDPGPKQMPEFSCVIADELISMFYGREWFDSGQNDAIKLLNMCRDRHLAVFGAVPNFWELDKNFRSAVRFWIHVDERGIGWIFQQTRNPGAKDKWCQMEIESSFKKKGSPYSASNFVANIMWDDWSTEEKEEYLAIRNTKRVGIEDQRARPEKWVKIKGQRNALMRVMCNDLKYPHTRVAKIAGVSKELVGKVCNGMLA